MVLRSGLIPLRLAIAFFRALSLAGCWKKCGKGIVLAKEHLEIAEIMGFGDRQLMVRPR